MIESSRFLMVLCLLLVAGASAQEEVVRSIPLDQPTAGRDYILQVGDKLEVHVVALPELEKAYSIRVDGYFFHPVIGEVQAAGRSLDDLRNEIGQRLAKELRNPSFRIGLINYAQDTVSVLGEVGSQGKHTIRKGASLIELLAQVGGFSAKADRQTATVLRKGEHLEVSLLPSAAPFVMESGDILYVHSGMQVSISGAVLNPGTYAVSRSSATPVLDLLKAAGGAKTTAALHRVKLRRLSNSKPQLVDLMSAQDGELQQLALEDGDYLIVPARQAMLMGGVAGQGAIDLEGGETLVGLLSQAKLSEKAKLDEVVVIRADDVREGRDKKEIYNLEDFFRDSDSEGESVQVAINDGDLVYVPVRADRQGGLFGGNNLFNLIWLARGLFF